MGVSFIHSSQGFAQPTLWRPTNWALEMVKEKLGKVKGLAQSHRNSLAGQSYDSNLDSLAAELVFLTPFHVLETGL